MFYKRLEATNWLLAAPLIRPLGYSQNWRQQSGRTASPDEEPTSRYRVKILRSIKSRVQRSPLGSCFVVDGKDRRTSPAERVAVAAVAGRRPPLNPGTKRVSSFVSPVMSSSIWSGPVRCSLRQSRPVGSRFLPTWIARHLCKLCLTLLF